MSAVVEPVAVIGSTQKNAYVGDGSISATLTSAMGEGGGHVPMLLNNVEPIRLGGLFDDTSKHQAGSVWNIDGLAPTLDTRQGGYRQPCVMTLNNKDLDGNQPQQQDRVYSTDGVMTTITATLNGRFNILESEPKLVEENWRVRKLTPKECWRLQAFPDSAIDKCIDAGISNTQLYKMAGNSITVTVLENIYKNLFKIK